MFINELQKYGRTSYQCDKNTCQIKDSNKNKGIGVYWASNEDKAIVYWKKGSGSIYIKLFGKINDLDTIDTLNTILSEIEYQTNEDEIRLYKDREIEIFKIENENLKSNEVNIIEGNWKAIT